jgi:hypothetical protein
MAVSPAAAAALIAPSTATTGTAYAGETSSSCDSRDYASDVGNRPEENQAIVTAARLFGYFV